MARSLAIIAEAEDDLHLCVRVAKRAGLPPPGNKHHQPQFLALDGNDADKLADRIRRWGKAELQTVLVLLDADNDASGTYARLIRAAKAEEIELPAVLPPEGLVHDLPDGRRVAVWVFPDNVHPGMMEDFFREVVVPAGDGLLSHTEAWVGNLLANAQAVPSVEPFARFSARHRSKATLRTWLAAQARPGLPPGRAVEELSLPLDERAAPFVGWLRRALADPPP